MWFVSLNCSTQPMSQALLYVRKTRLRELKWLIQSHMASKWQRQNSNSQKSDVRLHSTSIPYHNSSQCFNRKNPSIGKKNKLENSNSLSLSLSERYFGVWKFLILHAETADIHLYFSCKKEVCVQQGLGFFFLIFIYLFVYLWLCWVFVSVRGLSLVAASGGPLFIAVRGPLTIAASLVAEHRLQTRRLSSCGSRA